MYSTGGRRLLSSPKKFAHPPSTIKNRVHCATMVFFRRYVVAMLWVGTVTFYKQKRISSSERPTYRAYINDTIYYIR